MPRHISSTLRRYLKANRLLFSDFIVMRACSYCRTYNFFCVITSESPYYERYFRSYLKYELVSSDVKVKRFFKKEERLISEIITAYAKITRLRK